MNSCELRCSAEYLNRTAAPILLFHSTAEYLNRTAAPILLSQSSAEYRKRTAAPISLVHCSAHYVPVDANAITWLRQIDLCNGVDVCSNSERTNCHTVLKFLHSQLIAIHFPTHKTQQTIAACNALRAAQETSRLTQFFVHWMRSAKETSKSSVEIQTYLWPLENVDHTCPQ